MAAARAVFDIYELLENILLYLPVQDLLRAEQISKKSKSLMGQSQKISQALFRRPYGMDRTNPTDVNFQLFPEFGLWRRENRRMHNPVFNPLLSRFTDCGGYDIDRGRRIIHHGFVDPRDRYGNITSLKPYRVLMRCEASWKSMYFTQPPITKLRLDKPYPYNEAFVCGDMLDFDSSGGLKAEEVWKRLVDHWHMCPLHPTEEDEYSGRYQAPGWSYDGKHALTMLPDDVTGWEVLAELQEEEAAWMERSKAEDSG